MGYIPPPAVAADFNLGRKNYVPPPGSAVDVDFATDGGSALEYSRVPGVIANFGLPWNPQPGLKQSAISALFEQAEQRGITRYGNAANASVQPEPIVCVSHDNASIRDNLAGVEWDDSIQSRENLVVITSENAPQKDITARRSPWANASKILEPYVASTFLIRTPHKDILIRERYYSSAVFAALWRKPENKPIPFAPRIQGVANLEFYDRRNLRRPSVYEFGAAWENNPIQPKDPRFTMPAGNAIVLNDDNCSGWGAGRAIDITRAVVAESYVGPIDDGGTDSDENTFAIPTLRFYIVSNSAQIVRVSDGRDIPASAVSLSINADAYTWSLSATLAGRDAAALVEGNDAEPVEVDVMINGESWRVLVDAWQLSEAWRRNSVTITGRSRAAYLAAPYALPRDYIEGSELLAAQLAEQELPSGWSLDWSLDDWIVDAGAWKYQKLAPIDAIARIAASGGGYVQADRSADTIHVRPLYPAAPWNWINEAPDFQVPRDVMLQRQSSKKPGLGLNGVFVHGADEGGILAKVVRTGSAGDALATTIVDPLITDTTPARNRGIAALAASQRQALEVHELPLSADLGGLIEPGALIASGEDYEGDFQTFWRGIVRGVTVSAGATRGSNGGTTLKVRQQIQVERHFNEEF